MKEKAMIAKIPYSVLFEGGMYGSKDDRLTVVRLVTKINKDPFKIFKDYMMECAKHSNYPEMFSWFVTVEPIYTKAVEINDNLFTTLVYPFRERTSGYSYITNAFSGTPDGVGMRKDIPVRFRGNNRIPCYMTSLLQNTLIDIVDYNRSLQHRSSAVIISRDDFNAEHGDDNMGFYHKIASYLNILDEVRYNLTMKWSINPKKGYTHNSIVKTTYSIYDNFVTGLNSREPGDMGLMSPSSYYYTFGVFEPQNRRLRVSNSNKFVYHSNGHKYKVVEIDDKIVAYDSNKAFENFKDAIPEWEAGRFIILSQYNSLDQNAYINGGRNKGKIIIRFLSPKDISFREEGLNIAGDYRGQLTGKVWKNHRASYYNINYDFTGDNLYMDAAFDGVIPFGEKLDDAVNKLNAFLKAPDAYKFTEYAHTLFAAPVVNPEGEEDILSAWFTSCVKAKKHTDDDILKSYRYMKANLIREYRALEEYMSNYDFSKVVPVPKVILDKKTKENLYKSLHILARNIKINNVNNKKIKEINKTQAVVDLMFTKQNNIITGSYPLVKFYNPTTNSLEFNYNKMKGELINDKIKNRR